MGTDKEPARCKHIVWAAYVLYILYFLTSTMAVAVVGEIGSSGEPPNLLGSALGLLSLAAFGAIGFCHGYLGWRTLHRFILSAAALGPVLFGWMYLWSLTGSETLTNILRLADGR